MITATNVTPSQNGIFFMGPTQVAAAPFGDGLKCVGGQLFRYLPPSNSGAGGVLTAGPGIVAKSQTFAMAGRIDSGETWNFQCWYRDPMGPCGNGFTSRMFYEFGNTDLTGKKVLKATFTITETWSFTCDPYWVDLSRTSGTITCRRLRS